MVKASSIEIVKETRSWIGTPYRHQHSTKGQGCDCLGLVRGVYAFVHGRDAESPPPYSPTWGESGRKEFLLDAAQTYLTPVEDAYPGDVLVFRMLKGRIAKHCGIVSKEGYMIHAYQGAGRVEETRLVPYWMNRFVGVFRF